MKFKVCFWQNYKEYDKGAKSDISLTFWDEDEAIKNMTVFPSAAVVVYKQNLCDKTWDEVTYSIKPEYIDSKVVESRAIWMSMEAQPDDRWV